LSFEILTPKPLTPGDLELEMNTRSRSAKLRAGRKIKNVKNNLLLKIFML
ncbi:MAG: 16S rRNA (cytosine(1402)-N(4))-methyltransferase, partial [Candidatus Omnitrophica bacterium]|nr:16S rRNA (cytosine(1402)-N(4))-methyltransferase [Candidatus Omnitrophota bacterium]